jgi:hypothetical protein
MAHIGGGRHTEARVNKNEDIPTLSDGYAGQYLTLQKTGWRSKLTDFDTISSLTSSGTLHSRPCY